MLYKGSCHCGNMTFEVEGDLTQVVHCNCSICARKGARCCGPCRAPSYAEDAGEAAERSAYVNVRCLEGIDVAALPVIEFDGRSM